MRITGIGRIACVLAALSVSSLAGQQPSGPHVTVQDLRDGLKDPTRWLQYSGDYTAQRHSPLTQLTPANVNRLVSQWTFQTDQSPLMLTGRSGGLGVPLA